MLLYGQPGHPFVGRHSEYQPKGHDALQLGSKGSGRYGLYVGGRCDIPLLPICCWGNVLKLFLDYFIGICYDGLNFK